MASSPTGSPMWLSHHWPEHHDRCLDVRGTAVCRRCVVLYPLVVVAAGLALVVDLLAATGAAAMWLLPLPMSVEWVAEQSGWIRHSPRRLMALTALAAAGVGAALALHLRQPFHPDALAPMATHATICAVSSILAARRRDETAEVRGRAAWERRHDHDEAARDARLVRILAEHPGER